MSISYAGALANCKTFSRRRCVSDWSLPLAQRSRHLPTNPSWSASTSTTIPSYSRLTTTNLTSTTPVDIENTLRAIKLRAPNLLHAIEHVVNLPIVLSDQEYTNAVTKAFEKTTDRFASSARFKEHPAAHKTGNSVPRPNPRPLHCCHTARLNPPSSPCRLPCRLLYSYSPQKTVRPIHCADLPIQRLHVCTTG